MNKFIRSALTVSFLALLGGTALAGGEFAFSVDYETDHKLPGSAVYFLVMDKEDSRVVLRVDSEAVKPEVDVMVIKPTETHKNSLVISEEDIVSLGLKASSVSSILIKHYLLPIANRYLGNE